MDQEIGRINVEMHGLASQILARLWRYLSWACMGLPAPGHTIQEGIPFIKISTGRQRFSVWYCGGRKAGLGFGKG